MGRADSHVLLLLPLMHTFQRVPVMDWGVKFLKYGGRQNLGKWNTGGQKYHFFVKVEKFIFEYIYVMYSSASKIVLICSYDTSMKVSCVRSNAILDAERYIM